ncbi:hypothetical protein CTAYLR_003091 [Chrysophaeum taylorii]|uniref:Mto1-like Mto2p-binding domain-containing protein n=1 Tax=Chrysophaeum taylorii TaxID=2483200 RepID=A0AAD7U6F0_9STRA|nr:hypothetical protein CTAYLR_003091 [Chrysophaeum taylorii]
MATRKFAKPRRPETQGRKVSIQIPKTWESAVVEALSGVDIGLGSDEEVVKKVFSKDSVILLCTLVFRRAHAMDVDHRNAISAVVSEAFRWHVKAPVTQQRDATEEATTGYGTRPASPRSPGVPIASLNGARGIPNWACAYLNEKADFWSEAEVPAVLVNGEPGPGEPRAFVVKRLASMTQHWISVHEHELRGGFRGAVIAEFVKGIYEDYWAHRDDKPEDGNASRWERVFVIDASFAIGCILCGTIRFMQNGGELNLAELMPPRPRVAPAEGSGPSRPQKPSGSLAKKQDVRRSAENGVESTDAPRNVSDAFIAADHQSPASSSSLQASFINMAHQVQARLVELETRLDAERRARGSARFEIDDLRAENEELRVENGKLRAEIDDLRAEGKDLRAEKGALVLAGEDCETTVRELRARLKILDARVKEVANGPEATPPDNAGDRPSDSDVPSCMPLETMMRTRFVAVAVESLDVTLGIRATEDARTEEVRAKVERRLRDATGETRWAVMALGLRASGKFVLVDPWVPLGDWPREGEVSAKIGIASSSTSDEQSVAAVDAALASCRAAQQLTDVLVAKLVVRTDEAQPARPGEEKADDPETLLDDGPPPKRARSDGDA